MCFLFSLIPATIFVVLGYFVLYTSKKSEGGVQKFGCILAAWVFFIALLFPACGAYVTVTGKCHKGHMMKMHHMGGMHKGSGYMTPGDMAPKDVME